jgi:hypothetical protein
LIACDSLGGSVSAFVSEGLLGRPNLNSFCTPLEEVVSKFGIGPLNVEGVVGKPNRNVGFVSGFGSEDIVVSLRGWIGWGGLKENGAGGLNLKG